MYLRRQGTVRIISGMDFEHDLERYEIHICNERADWKDDRGSSNR